MSNQSDSLLCYLAQCWLRRRHGNVYSIEPPRGWSRMVDATWRHKIAFWPKFAVWKIESRLHQLHGQPLRSAAH